MVKNRDGLLQAVTGSFEGGGQGVLKREVGPGEVAHSLFGLGPCLSAKPRTPCRLPK
jgi:hypothetical protein